MSNTLRKVGLTFSKASPNVYVSQFKSFENTEGKAEIARNKQFLLVTQCFLPFWLNEGECVTNTVYTQVSMMSVNAFNSLPDEKIVAEMLVIVSANFEEKKYMKRKKF